MTPAACATFGYPGLSNETPGKIRCDVRSNARKGEIDDLQEYIIPGRQLFFFSFVFVMIFLFGG